MKTIARTWEIVEIGECVNFPVWECRVIGINADGNKIEGSCLIEDPDGAEIWGPVYDTEVTKVEVKYDND